MRGALSCRSTPCESASPGASGSAWSSPVSASARILLLAALGLAITYGLMGVINMAHGELMMIGAYATYVVQNLFRKYVPGAFDYYIVVAIPASFLVAALVGAMMERSVIRWLYGRPLETLLATWGISLVLMQAVRTLFGAQNVPVENPAWLSGGIAVMSNLTLPYNRIAIIAFAALVLAGRGAADRTHAAGPVRARRDAEPPDGLVRRRQHRACRHRWRSRWAQASPGWPDARCRQVGNVGPDLGQSYIVDSFMVVVLGGVGPARRHGLRGLGLGVLNKFLEGWAGAVLAKIMVLVFIVDLHPEAAARAVRDEGPRVPKPERGHERSHRSRHCRRGFLLLGIKGWTARDAAVIAVLARRAGAQPGRARRQRAAPERLHGGADRQDHVLRDLRARDGPDLGLHRHPVARPRPVLRARRLRDGHVPDAPDRPRRQLQERPARLHGVPELEGAAVALGAVRIRFIAQMLLVVAGARACSPSCSASSPSARASRACTSRSSRRR
ncbi:MAG: hypothetical protein QM796_12610 [Chthoniobacteraceae bacterium]